LWKIPEHLIRQWPGRILNIHPALLPKYGGPGMYGDRVHKAVIQNGEKESGITIHIVDPLYDHGPILFQATCPVDLSDTPETLAAKIHDLERLHFPMAADRYISQTFKDRGV
ncbi:MAG: formyltransferase family protein, partial [Bacteroidales bacterium]